MTSDGILILEWYFENLFKFFTEWKIPGTNVTPATWFIFLIIAGVLLTFISKFLGTSWFSGR